MARHLTNDKSISVQVMAWAVRQQAITWANVEPDSEKFDLGEWNFIKNT